MEREHTIKLTDDELDALEVVLQSADFYISESALDKVPDDDADEEEKMEYRYYSATARLLPSLWEKFHDLMPDRGAGAEERLAAIVPPEQE